MEMIPVDSSNISAIGYEPDNATLCIEFHGGRIYEYYDVPQHVFDEFLVASSKGSFAHQKIYKNYNQQRIA